MVDTTVIIKTIGRPSLKAAIRSAKREKLKTIVISDGVKVSAQGANRVIRLGRKWGFYGGMSANVGAALAETEFITFLDDDDEFAVGAGDIIRNRLNEKPEVDVWIGGVRFSREINVYNTNTGQTLHKSTDLATGPGLGVVPGNACMPTYRANIFSTLPFLDNIPEDQSNLTDFYHINACKLGGYNIDWFGDVIYLVRPDSSGENGMGR